MSIGGVVIQFMADTAKSVTNVDNLTRALKGTDDQAESTGSKLKKKLAVGAAAVGTALVGVGAAMVDFAKAAAEDSAEAQTLADTLKTIPGITDKMVDANSAWIDSMELASNVSDTDLRTAISKLTLATGSLTDAQDLTTIALDASAGSGKNLDSITSALAKAVNGNTGALQKNFPWLDKNKDGSVTLDEALKGLKGAYEGAAEAAADKKPWERFSTLMGQLKETIGEQLLPYLDRFSEWLKDKKNQEKLKDFADDLGSIASAAAGLAKIVWGIVDALKSAWTWIDNVNKKWQGFLDNVNKGVTWPWEKGGLWPWQNSGSRSGGNALRSTGVTANTRAAGGSTTYAPTVVVTEEQIYRAVSRLVLRGDARNGRAALAVP